MADAPENLSASPRFIVGIDLGTTNCAVAFVDTRGGGTTVQDFPVRQVTAPGVTEARDTLPSFLVALTDPERTDTDTRIHPHYRIGLHAREHGALTPGRLITSAKSWLCHPGIDRRSPILPWHAAPDVPALSPVEAQAAILAHLRTAWDNAHPDHPLAAQQVCITVPASFDEIARELTIDAARKAGLPALLLLEEPQAAFYAWLARHETNWSERIAPDDQILVCDVGGGTTDFTLIHAQPAPSGPVVFHRTAVGDHLILGGDNLDLALAHALEPDLAGGGQLDPRSWSVLVRRCRHYKETLLGEHPPDTVDVVLPGSGAGLLRQQRTATLARTRAETLLLDGFMPLVPLDARPAKQASGFQEFDLPYAPDPGITRYLATFLRDNLPRDARGNPVPPRAILLNGGLFESPAMQRRLVETLTAWFGANGEWTPNLLDHRRLDLAVARGAAYFGLVRRGLGVRVVSDLARSYYLGLGGQHAGQVLCVAPARLAAGDTLVLDEHPLAVTLKTPVEFPLFVSSRRTTDAAGQLVDLDPDSFTALPPMRTVLSTGKHATQDTVPASLSTHLTELGSLELAIVERAGTRRWKLAFDVRAATRTELSYHDGTGERAGMIEAGLVEDAARRLTDLFAMNQQQLGSTSVFKALEQAVGLPRAEWPVSLLRSLWTTAMALADQRRSSAIHEQRWLNVTGFCLRPGFGVALDDWRVGETWKLFPRGLHYAANETVRAEWWIFWRRVCGGLNAGQQSALALPQLAQLRNLMLGKGSVKIGDHERVEWFRLLAVLERLPVEQRTQLGTWMLQRIEARGNDRGAALWALGRLGSRVPLYGSIQQIIPAETAATWLRTLIASPASPELPFALLAIARRTGDRYRDLDEASRTAAATRLAELDAAPHWITLVTEGGHLDATEQDLAFGDQLPPGLTLLDG